MGKGVISTTSSSERPVLLLVVFISFHITLLKSDLHDIRHRSNSAAILSFYSWSASEHHMRPKDDGPSHVQKKRSN